MNEKYLLARHNFQNVRENGQVTGFQVKVKIPYYRGVYISQIESPMLKVNDEEFSGEQITMSFTVHGPAVQNSPLKTYTVKEMETASNARWWFGDPAIMTVKKPGGLKPGVYQVLFGIVARNSYSRKGPVPPGGLAVPGKADILDVGPAAVGYRVTQKMTLVR